VALTLDVLDVDREVDFANTTEIVSVIRLWFFNRLVCFKLII
jgi:hypothetical protein